MFEDNIYEEALGEDQTNALNESIEVENEDPDPADPSSTKVEIKIRKVRNTIRPIDRFMSDRGLQSIGEFYKDVRYKGKHHEKEDINLIMGRMQHWAHRAFPKMKFDDALDVVEGLTKKRIIQTHMHKYRMDMLQPVVVQQTENDNPEEDDPLEGVQPMDEFDDLLSDQIEQMTRVQQRKAHSTALNNTSMMNQSDVSLGCAAIPSTPEPTRSRLSSEQMAKIAENRLKALERLKQKRLEMDAAPPPDEAINPDAHPNPNESIDLDD